MYLWTIFLERPRLDKEAFLASFFLKISSGLFSVVYIHIIKAICYSYHNCAQTFVDILTVAIVNVPTRGNCHFS